MGAAHARRERPWPFRSAVLARLLPAHSRRRRLSQRRRHRRYYPTEVPLHHRSAWLGRQRSVRHARRRLPRDEHARHRADRSARGARRSPRGASRLDLDRRGRRASRAPLGQSRAVGDLRARSRTTSSSWTRCTARSSRSTGWTASSRTAGRRRAATATACTARRTSRPRRGLDLPRTTDVRRPGAAPASRVECRAADRRCGSSWDASIRAINPDGALHSERHARSEDRRRAGAHPVRRLSGATRRHARVDERAHAPRSIRSVMGRRPIGGIFSVGVEEPYRWKDSVQSEPEMRQWVAEGTANGMRPWFTKFSGVLYDRRWLPVVERIYQWHADARALPAQRVAARARRAAAVRSDRDVSSGRRARATAPPIT